MKEVWKPLKDIVEHGDYYEVSSLGRVRKIGQYVSNGRGIYLKKGRVLKLQKQRDGYLSVALCVKNKQKRYSPHRLVALAFLSNLEGKPCVNHINGIKDDNRLENLEWCTNSENQKHAFATGLKKATTGESHGCSKLKEVDVRKIKILLREGNLSQKEIGEMFGVRDTVISRIKNGKRWAHIA